MNRNKLIAIVVVVLLAVVMTFIVQVKNYTADIDSARTVALENWAEDNSERKLQLLAFRQHCSGDNVKKYPSIYVCAEKQGVAELQPILSAAADSVAPPKLLHWLFSPKV